ncbi:MAG: hypothetical protein ACTHPS_11840 [Streptosporangiaceae bacterium]
MPELDDGTDDDGLRPLEPALLDVPEPEPDPAVLVELLDAAEPAAADLCACPGKTRETTPATTRPPHPAAAVIARTRLRPRFRADTARAIKCCGPLFMM